MAAPAMPWTVPGTAPRDEEEVGLGDPSAGTPAPLSGEDAAEAEAAALDAGGLYAALNLPRDADEEAVRRAYRSLAGACHPDKVAPDLREAASEQFARLQRAYEVRWEAVGASAKRPMERKRASARARGEGHAWRTVR